MSVSRIDSGALASKTRLLLVATGVAVAALLAGCATPETAVHYKKGREHFAAGKKWGKASPKVVQDGQPVPREDDNYSAVGMASWYGAAFHGRRTSNGEIYDMSSITAAHPTMPLPSYARVTNLTNGYSVIVRVNDRGPFHGGRVMDVSSRTADILGFKGGGTAKIKVDYVGRAPMEGSDDSMLLASLRTDGTPAILDGYGSPVMVASAATSVFGGIFSSSPSSPAPEPAPVAAPPAPPPEPVQVASTTQTAKTEPDSQANDDAPPARVAEVRQPRKAAPLPPPRPFDLGEIRATIKVAEARPEKPIPIGVLPPRKPMQQASAGKALY